MAVCEITTATITEEEVQVHLHDDDHAAEAEARIGTGVGVAAPDVWIGTGDDRPREPHPLPLGTALGSIHVHRPLVVPGDPGRTRLLLGEILEVTAPCHHLQGGVHHLLFVVIAAARLEAIAGRVHLRGRVQGRDLPQENVVVLLLLALRCQ